MSRGLRLVTTHDFFGSFATVPTSYGALPGGDALRAAVNELRRGRSSLWLDSGDLFQGGALTVPTMGKGGLKAAAELGIDLSVIGNHDLDFGVEFLRKEATDLGFPLLSANAEIGFPATAILPTSNADVGIIGLTHHNLSSMIFVDRQAGAPHAWTRSHDIFRCSSICRRTSQERRLYRSLRMSRWCRLALPEWSVFGEPGGFLPEMRDVA